MRFLLISLIIVLPTCIFCQTERDIPPVNEMDSILLGTWKLKGSEHKSKFNFSSSVDGLICTVYQSLEEKDESTSIVHETKVKIDENDIGYDIQWDYPLFYWKGRIEKLKRHQLLVEINGNVLKFTKENN